uniref:Activator of basal transcription 1 n=1 Tax=Acrobeloides nanus TaxID=290746 RepID=A0A914CQH9_9BILA
MSSDENEKIECEIFDGAQGSSVNKEKKKRKRKFFNSKRDLSDITVVKKKQLTLEDVERDLDEEEPSTATKPDDPEEKQRKSGVVYLQTIPPLYTVSRIREEFSNFGIVGRVYLQAEKQRAKTGKMRKRYVEGWVEFENKKVAKKVATMLNGSLVGGKRRSMAHDTLWVIKYLHGFKWIHLMEQLSYEKKVEQQRLRAEISQAKRQAEFFAQQVEKGAKIRRLEEKVLKKGGLWDQYQRQVKQQSVIKESQKKKSRQVNESTDFLHMIFDAKE